MHPMAAEALTRERSGGGVAPLTGISGALANTRLFSLCSRKELRTVAKVAKIRNVPKGTRLMAEGDEGDTMYVIVSGVARVSRKGRKVAAVGAGDAVGELAVLGRAKRNASVDADTDLQVAEISRRSLSKLINAVPPFSMKLLEAMATRVRELDSRLYP
ncbi:MAG: Crp/Fnr family transcriptional regulator [Acidimicrobiia bacterium]|jgi:CRP/FNR family transcriptional regulator, cyclic AMP receptor protein